jgi:hypothetical protein
VPLGIAWVTLGVNARGLAVSLRRTAGRSTACIVLAPFLHSSFSHLAANSLSFLVLGWLVLAGGQWTFARVTAVGRSARSSPHGCWAPGSVHSAPAGDLRVSQVPHDRQRDGFRYVLVSLGVTAMWGRHGVGRASANGRQRHLGGFIGGVLAARWVHAREQRRQTVATAGVAPFIPSLQRVRPAAPFAHVTFPA